VLDDSIVAKESEEKNKNEVFAKLDVTPRQIINILEEV
jgi:hypothetical protein